MLSQKQNSLPASAAASSSQEITEARQESQIWTAFALNPHLRGNEIHIAVRNGRATLSGKVADSVSRDLAFQITQGVKGITLVDDRLDVDANHAPPAQSAQRAFGNLVDDATISCRVKSKVLWSRHGVGIRAHVDTARGVVNLSGTAHTDEARDFAGKLAANTSGVRAVENQLVVKPVKAGVELSGVPDIADVWITAKVKSTFKLSNDLDGAAIAISTNAGTVKLTGRLDSIAERAVAIELAGNVRGAKTVDSSALTL